LQARAAAFRKTALEKEGVLHSIVDIYSDGTRMTGTVWRAKANEGKLLPVILLCHGWGGKRGHLDYSYAPQFAKAGFCAVTFDYRGWGDSDGVLVAASGRQPKPDADGTVTIKARVVRKIVDPEWQVRDIDSALNFISAMEGVDVNRIGLWGSSFGGGHVLAVAARDPRVKVVVTQIGSINTHVNWVNRHPEYKGVVAIQQLASKHARGEVFPWNLSKPKGLDGMPNLPKVVFEHTRNTLDAVKLIKVPVMILPAEKEELFPNAKNSGLVYELLKAQVPTEMDFLPGAHYDAYGGESYKKGLKRATEWFQLYIGDAVTTVAKL